MTTWITICDGCKRSDWTARGVETTDGAALAQDIEACARTAGVKTRRVSCTMGCERACNVIIQGSDDTGQVKIGYALGSFDGTAEDAQAITDFAALHAQSLTGQVPFRTWPIGVKGHFVSRHLPLPITPATDEP
jgi:predicted metal-binding protein